MSGVVITDATNAATSRFTFPQGTTLAAGRAVVVFGGAQASTFNASDPAFGGALVLFAPGTGTLSLNDTGDTVTVKLSVGGADTTIATVTYGSTGNPVPAPSDQSLTRTPDAEIGTMGGNFVAHTAATNAASRTFSPGTRADGTPFGSPAITRIEITPAQASINTGATQSFSARAFSNASGMEVEVPNVSFIFDSSVTTVATVNPLTGTTTTATAGMNPGTTTIRARAGGQQATATLTVNPVVASIDLQPDTASITVGASQTFTATARDANNNVITGLTFSFSLRNPSPANAATITATTANTVTVRGDNAGSVSVVANYTQPGGATFEDVSTLTVNTPIPTPSISINDATVTEGNTGTVNAVFTVTLSNASDQTVTVAYATANGTATASTTGTPATTGDYEPASGTLTFIPGETTKTIAVVINGDTTIEPNETFSVNLTSPVNATIADNQGIGTILNDDVAQSTISINDVSITEGDTGSQPAQFTVTLNPVSNQTVTVDYTIANGTATAGADYSTASMTGRLTFNPGDSAKTIDLAILGDLLDEPNETFTITLSNPTGGAAITKATGTGTILDNDPTPSLSINSASSAPEGNTGATNTVNFTVTLSAQSGQQVTVTYATTDGTATAGTDYQATSGQLTFAAGETSKVISVPIIGDTVVENDETFTISLSNPTNATIASGQGTGTGTIINDDTAPASANLSITKTAPTSVNRGSAFNYSLAVGNAGPDAASNVVVTDALPAGLTYNSATPSQGTCSFSAANNTVTCALGTLNSSTSASIVINVTATAAGTVSNTATVTSDTADPNSSNNSATATTTVVPMADLSITKTDSPDPVAIGNDITYTITIANGGPNAASSVTLTDTVPTNTTFRSITAPTGWSCTNPAVGATGTITCTNSSLSSGATAVFTLVVRVGAAVTDGTTISNTASVSSSTADPNSANNSATTTTTAKTPMLVISQIYPGGGNAGATYTNDFIEIFNRGTTTVDFLATNYSVQYTSQTGNFGGTTASVKFNITSGTIAPGQYFLIQGASSNGCTSGTVPCGVALPTPDATSSIALAATAGKVALVLGTAALPAFPCPGANSSSPSNPNNSVIVDFVGYGSTSASPNCYEGSGPAPFSTSTAGGLNPNARSTIRASSCQDNNDNSMDFTNPTAAPTARNSATTKTPCP